MPRLRKVRFEVSRAEEGSRLDQVLAAHVPALSRRQARVLLDLGGVFLDRARVKVAGRRVRAGQVVEANLGGALARATGEVGSASRARDEERLPRATAVFEDEAIIVVEKPAGLLTAPTPESDRGNLLYQLGPRPSRRRLYLVHRLDLMSSGLVVVAKTAKANRVLAEAFRRHAVERAYLAVVAGAVAVDCLVVDQPIGGRRALTRIAVEERRGAHATRIRAALETGRTHQIRIHCRSLGHPVLGDRQYGTRTHFDPPRLALHAAVLGFVHPQSGESLRFESPLPDDLATWYQSLP